VRPGIVLLDVRESPELVASLRVQGINVNDSAVSKLGAMCLVGHEAFTATFRTDNDRRGLWTKLVRLASHEKVAKPLYPFLVVGRKLLLRILGRGRI
jgi:hypothetical protein